MKGRTCLRSGPVCGLGLAAVLWAVSGCETGEPAGSDEPAQAETDPTPHASSAALRTMAVQATMRSLEEECRRGGGGDWEQWSRSLQPYRDALAARVRALKPNFPEAENRLDRYAMLEAAGEPLLYEPGPAWFLNYLLDPQALEPFRRELPVAVAAQWLRSQGIDLVFVPVPKMTEVYPDRQAQPCPADRIVAPHVRRLLWELLEHDVEVLDLLPTFLAAVDRSTQPLYFADDPHWNPRGQQLAARALAERLGRYRFVRDARAGLPLFQLKDRPWAPQGSNFTALTLAQQQRVDRARPALQPEVIPLADVGMVDQASPILFIGDSYNIGFAERTACELNLPVATFTGAGHTTQAFTEAVRNPELLHGRKVVVWTICATHLDKASWALPPQVAPQAGKGVAPQSQGKPSVD